MKGFLARSLAASAVASLAVQGVVGAPTNQLPQRDGTYTDSIEKMSATIKCPNGISGAGECIGFAHSVCIAPTD